MRKKTIIAVLNCIIILLAGTCCALGQENATALKDKRITVKIDHQPLRIVFGQLINNYDVTIGFEESTLDQANNDYEFIVNLPFLDPKRRTVPLWSCCETPQQHWITVNIENGRLEDVLNIIVGQMKNYKWEINDGVINIFPTQGRDERYERLLNVTIKNFAIEKGRPIFLIRNKLFDLPEVVNCLKENKIFSSKIKGDFMFTDRKLPVEMNFSNITFKELLNKIAKTKGGGWILKKSDVIGTKEKEYIDIEI